MKKKSIGVLVMLVMALFLGACSSSNKLLGTWENSDLNLSYTFNKDGTVIQETLGFGLEGTYEIESNTIKLALDDAFGVVLNLPYKISGETLSLNINGLEVRFTKVD